MSILKTDQDNQEFLDWVVTLKYGGLPRGEWCLENKRGFCCLGVGVALLVEKPHTLHGGRLAHNLPVDQPAPLWLVRINADFSDRSGRDLSSLNDHERLTFPQIADKLIEVYGPELGVTEI